ncbi:hypothetical protein ILUMI_00540 [Ignelater luminosus]|uniref:Amine oxidase domain-containing protein n=1 Tax=Ignelater luminosus TaxID=2038154 RepID=A0A8K0GQ48_IGNLU|nr:hypothetical protein ILUMI_00540 [Ignelater luminosus]
MVVLKTIVLLFAIQILSYITCEKMPSVIIIGAGPAGIAAATRLFKNNITNIKVLEAENRIGGRIYSLKFGDAFVDLGAEWYHGGEDNPIYHVIKELDLIEVQDTIRTYYHSSGKDINKDLVAELRNIFFSIYYASNIKTDKDVSIGQYVKEKYLKAIDERYRNASEKLEFAKEFLDVLKKDVELFQGAFSWNEPSAESDYIETSPSILYHWKNRGYKAVLDVLLQKYPDPEKELPIEILLNKEVKQIFWNNEVSVKCTDGSEYKADHIILTVPLGVLKDRYAQLFNPELPQEKQNAINELGISAVQKIFFHFPKQWWPNNNFHSIDFFWTEEDRVRFLKEKKDKSWLLGFTGLYPTPYNPNVLQTWFCGENVPKIELLPDEEIINGLMLMLNRFVGKYFENITTPDSLLRFNWYEQSHFRGTYSYQTVKSRQRNISGQIALSKPMQAENGKMALLFAGEATNPTHYRTVHGAMETGFREADRIINFIKNK